MFLGRDPVSGRRRYATKTVRGGKRDARRSRHVGFDAGISTDWVDDRGRPSSPISRSSPPRLPAPDIRPPAPDDVLRRFRLAEETDPAFAVYVQLAAATGARRANSCVALVRPRPRHRSRPHPARHRQRPRRAGVATRLLANGVVHVVEIVDGSASSLDHRLGGRTRLAEMGQGDKVPGR